MIDHECKENPGCLIYIRYDEWGIDSIDDPYYGVHNIKYCPYCGVKLEK